MCQQTCNDGSQTSPSAIPTPRGFGVVLKDSSASAGKGAAADPALRDRFASRALQGMLAACTSPATGAHVIPDEQLVAAAAYHYADAMMKARQDRAACADFEQANLGAYGASAARAGASFGSASGTFDSQPSMKTFTRTEVLAVLRAQRAITMSSHISDLITIFERME
jgi:hypothetical protein